MPLPTLTRSWRSGDKARALRLATARYGIVVLSDGKDTNSRTTIPMLEDMLRPPEGDQTGIQVHTIGIGKDADDRVLTKIANSTHGGRHWKVQDSDTIGAVYRRISKYW